MIVLYTGRRGAGKTLTMIKDAYTYFNEGWDIYSNIELGFKHEYISEDDILEIGDSDLNNIVLVIDEIQVLVDSRRSGRKSNLNFSYFIQQIRKRNIIVLCTTQFSGTIDLRLRQHVDILARPKLDKALNVCAVNYTDLTVEDISDLETSPLEVSIVYDALPIYKLYDTMRIIQTVKEKEKEKKKKS